MRRPLRNRAGVQRRAISPSLVAAVLLLVTIPARTSKGGPTSLEAILDNLYERGIETCDQGRWEEALRVHERLTRLDPDYGFGWMGLGWSRQYTGDWQGAIDAYRRVLALGGMSASRVHRHMAECLARQGDAAGALNELAAAVDGGLPNLRAVLTLDAFHVLAADPKFGTRLRELCNDVDTSAMSRSQGWGTDLRILGKEVRRMIYNAPVTLPRAGFEDGLREIEGMIGSVPDAVLEVAIMKLVRRLGDGHTSARPADEQAAPVLLYRFEDGFYVTGADTAHRDLVWSRVVAVEGREPDEVLKTLGAVVSQDNPMGLLNQGMAMMRSPRILNGLGLAPDDQRLRLVVDDFRGSRREVTIEKSPAMSVIERTPPGVEAALPVHMRRRSELYWFEKLEDAPIIYFQYNGCAETEGRPLAEFARELVHAIESPDVRALVVDLRWNGGGNLFTSRPLLREVLGCRKLAAPGALFVIAGRCTFSAGMVFAAQLERHTPAIFVGEPTGSSPNFVGETNPSTLPYSGMRLSVSNLYWQTSTAQDTRPWISPKIRAPMTFAHWSEGRDEALEAIKAYLIAGGK